MIQSRAAVLALAATALMMAAACGDNGGPAATATPSVAVAPAASPAPSPSTDTVPDTPTPEPTTPAPSPTATVEAPPETGVLEVRVTDAPPEGVTKILVTVNNIEVHLAGGGEEKGWMTVIDEQRTFDLVAITGVEEVLGSSVLGVGKYTQIRLDVEEVKVTIQDVEISAGAPSDKLKVVGRFDWRRAKRQF